MNQRGVLTFCPMLFTFNLTNYSYRKRQTWSIKGWNHDYSSCACTLGLLDPSDTLMVMNTSNGDIKLSWTPPFTLDITDVDPDISNYTVYITNTNTSNTGTVSVAELDESGVVETEYTFTGLPGEDPDPCHVYQFSVSAWNVVGEGERSDPMEGYFVRGIRIMLQCLCISYLITVPSLI